ncbi:MAG: hypothetical protein ACOYI4_10230 [Christensenellales bacterium]|jgi:hypothetical protein
MSAFIVVADDKQIVVAADTLVVRKESGCYIPINYTSKIHPLLSKNSVILGVGCYQAIQRWCEIADQAIIARDIETLDKYSAPLMKKRLIGEFGDTYACIYQIGFDSKGNTRAYKYDSEEGYVGKAIDGKVFFRPGDVDVMKCFEGAPDVHTALYRCLCSLKEADSKETADGSSSIGGHMELLIMHDGSYSLERYKPFDEYEENYQRMCDQ